MTTDTNQTPTPPDGWERRKVKASTKDIGSFQLAGFSQDVIAGGYIFLPKPSHRHYHLCEVMLGRVESTTPETSPSSKKKT